MKTAAVADLRNRFRRVSAWIDNGEAAEEGLAGVKVPSLIEEGG